MKHREFVLAIDLGTTCFKAGLWDRTGRLAGLVSRPVEKEKDGVRCELPVQRFWATLKEIIAAVLVQADAGGESVRGIGYASQANTFLLLDRSRTPLTPLISWSDRRAAGMGDAGCVPPWNRPDFLAVTGLGLSSAEFCLVKLRWLRDREPEVWRRAVRLQTLSDCLVYGMAGQDLGDAGTASLLGIWDLRQQCWWREGLETADLGFLELSLPCLPGAFAGKTGRQAGDLVGLPEGIPVAIGSLDHHAAALGAGCCSPEFPGVSVGTVIACLRYQDRFEPLAGCAMGPGTHTYPYYRLAFEPNGTVALDSYRHQYGSDMSMEQMLSLASSVPEGSEGLQARAAGEGFRFENIRPEHGTGHFVRALMESTAAGLANLIGQACRDRAPRKIAVTGGGSRSDLWLQIMANVAGMDLVIPECREAGCLGAGMLAAVNAGWFRDLPEAVTAWSRSHRVIRPDSECAAFYRDWLSERARGESERGDFV